MTKQLVSVIMPVYNCEQYISHSVASILKQTFREIQLIIVDDASTDSTLARISKFNDSRITIIRNDVNRGLAASLNTALKVSNGQYIARMDGDDISLPERFYQQVSFLERNREIDILGGAMQYFGVSTYRNFFPAHHDSCKARLLFNVCFGHPTIMARSTVFANESIKYDESLKQYSEDYDLYEKLVDQYRFANLDKILLRYRTFNKSVKTADEERRRTNSMAVRARMLAKVGIAMTPEQEQLHKKACDFTTELERKDFELIMAWFDFILTNNRDTQYFKIESLKEILTQQAFSIAYANPRLGVSTSEMSERAFFCPDVLTVGSKIKFFLKKILLSK